MTEAQEMLAADEEVRWDTEVTLMNEAQAKEDGDWLFDTSGEEKPAPTWPDREVFVKMPHFYLRFRPEDLIVVEEAGFDTRCPVTMEAQADALAVILGMMTMCGNA